MQRLYPLTFEPLLVSKVWGGSKLAQLFGKPSSTADPIGESWEISAVSGTQSVVESGPLVGKTLAELVESFGPELLGSEVTACHGHEFPLLLKLIDASEKLSVQVHPDAEQAKRLGGGAQSKSEAWLILHADPGAKLVHGVAPGLDRARFAELVAAERIEECLRFVEVQPGDVVPVAPGTLHAIGKGVVLLELQQTSDTTYRFYDYNRLGLDGKPRQLHVEQALAVVNLDSGPAKATPQPLQGSAKRELLYANNVLEMQRLILESPCSLDADAARFWLILTLEGSITIKSRSPAPMVSLPKGRSALIPANLAIELNPVSQSKESKEKAVVFLGTFPIVF